MSFEFESPTHYSNSIKKLLRERFEINANFSEKSRAVIYILFKSSLKDGHFTAGYYFMTWLRFSCENLEDFKEAFESLLNVIDSYDLSEFDGAMECEILDDFEMVLTDDYGFNFNDYEEVTI